MKAMEGGGGSAGGLIGDTGGRHTRALAKRCIVLTEENRVRDWGKLMSESAWPATVSGGICILRMTYRRQK